MLSEQELKQIAESNRVFDAIQKIIQDYPEAQWVATAQKLFPNVSLLTIRENIMILCGGDVVGS